MAPHQLEGQFIIQLKVPLTAKQMKRTMVIMIIIDNFCVGLFSDVHKLTVFYNTLQHFLNEDKIIKGNNVHASNTYIYKNQPCIYIYL